MTSPAPLEYQPLVPRPSRWRKIILIIAASAALAWAVQYTSRIVIREWRISAVKRADARFQSALATYLPPAKVLVWSNHPADQTPEQLKLLGPSYATQPKGVLIHLPPQELADDPKLRMMPLAVWKREGGDLVEGAIIHVSWFEAVTVDFDWFPALKVHTNTNGTPYFDLPEPLKSAKTLRFWTSDLPIVEGKDLVLPVEADGKQYKLIRSWRSAELRLEE